MKKFIQKIKAITWTGMKDGVAFSLAMKLPPRVVLYCAVRVLGHTTTGKYLGRTKPDKLPLVKAMRRWRDDLVIGKLKREGEVANRPSQGIIEGKSFKGGRNDGPPTPRPSQPPQAMRPGDN